MQIKIKHMNAESAWKCIVNSYKNYQSNLKNYEYNYDMFIPDDDRMREMFEQPKLTEQQIQHYHDIFVNEIYKLSDLTHQDDNIKTAIPYFQNRIKTHIEPLLPAWGAKLPETLTIICTYGHGAGYNADDSNVINFRMSRDKRNDYGIYLVFLHEFVHILIEEQIIRKYNVPQDLKESIVEIIGFELFDKNQNLKDFSNRFAEAYITPEAIRNDLAGAVKKMMADYTLMQQRNTKDR